MFQWKRSWGWKDDEEAEDVENEERKKYFLGIRISTSYKWIFRNKHFGIVSIFKTVNCNLSVTAEIIPSLRTLPETIL